MPYTAESFNHTIELTFPIDTKYIQYVYDLFGEYLFKEDWYMTHSVYKKFDTFDKLYWNGVQGYVRVLVGVDTDERSETIRSVFSKACKKLAEYSSWDNVNLVLEHGI